MTWHVEYLAHVVELTIDQEMRKEATYLRSVRTARARIKAVIEGPDSDIDRIIRSVRDNEGKVSNKLQNDFPLLDDPDVGPEVIRIVQSAFSLLTNDEPNDPHTIHLE